MRQSNSIIWRSTWRNGLLAAICVSALALTAACSGNDLVCAQVITVAGPVVQITSVTNGQSSAAIGQFTLSSFTRDGQQQDAALMIAGVPNTNAAAVNGMLVCAGACGFGQSDGVYTFSVSAVGVQSKMVTVTAKYQTITSHGCAREETGGTSVAIAL